MIGNPKWFNHRKYTGWGLTPNCWQGWVYLLVYIIPIAVIDSISINPNLKTIIISVLVGILLIDTLYLMTQIPKDEREKLHEAIADRNTLWFLIFGLLIYAFIKPITDPVFFIIIIGSVITKAITQLYLRDK